MNFIRECICGFQTGADIGAARAAKAAGVRTFGWMPGKYTVEGGDCHPEYAQMYGARELLNIYGSVASEYRKRTQLNVRHVADRSGGILIFNGTPEWSPGTKLVLKIAREINRPGGSSGPTGKVLAPIIVVSPIHREHGLRIDNVWGSPEMVARHIRSDMNPDGGRALMVGGNRESLAPGIGKFVEAYMTDLFGLLEE